MDDRPMPLAAISGRRIREAVRRARQAALEQEEGPPPGRAAFVLPEDLEETQHRIRTGLPMAPLKVWRW